MNVNELMNLFYIYGIPTLSIISLLMIVITHFGYEKMYKALKKNYTDLYKDYRELLLNFHNIRAEYDKLIEKNIRLNKTEKKDDQDTGVIVDSDGKVKIINPAQTGQEAIAQIDEINRIINEQIKKQEE